MGYFILTHVVGAFGGLWAKHKRIPAGAMLGALALVVVINLVTGIMPSYPIELRLVLQVVSGVIIGSRFSRSDIAELRRMLAPVLILVVMLTGFNVLFAWIISSCTSLSLVTAMFASAPGGVSDLALVAADFNADTEQVALLQIFRFVVVVLCFPFFVRQLLAKTPTPEQPIQQVNHASVIGKQDKWQKRFLWSVLSIAVASVGAGIAKWIGIPAGIIIGSIIATVTLNVTTGKVYLPPIVKTGVQICAGCYIGMQMTRSVLNSLRILVLPMVLIVIELFLMAFVTAWVIHRVTKLDKSTSLFSCIPGGIAEMGIIAEEMRLDLPKIVLMHTCRIIAVMCFMPPLLKLFT